MDPLQIAIEKAKLAATFRREDIEEAQVSRLGRVKDDSLKVEAELLQSLQQCLAGDTFQRHVHRTSGTSMDTSCHPLVRWEAGTSRVNAGRTGESVSKSLQDELFEARCGGLSRTITAARAHNLDGTINCGARQCDIIIHFPKE